MNSESKHPLTDSEREITKAIVRRFVTQDEAATETDLMRTLKPFRASISESLRRLVDRSVLYVVNNTYTQETYAPRAIAFHYCGDVELLNFARRATELILRVIHNIVERELDSGSKDETKQYTREDALAEARTIDSTVTPEMIRVGLALAEEFSVFYLLQRNPQQQFGVVTFRPNRRVFQLENNPWEEHIRRSSVSVERAWDKQQPILVPPDEAIFDVRNSVIGRLQTQDDQEISRKIFLVHGHAEEVKQTLAAFLRTLDLEVVILHEQPNRGRTIIEKFEKHSDVGFAVVLLTPDDIGAPVDEPDKTKKRARQNVILELGYFTGKLGRGRVCPIYVEGVELPSDLHGVLWVAYDPQGQWRSKLAKEIQAAGIDVDFKKAVPLEG